MLKYSVGLDVSAKDMKAAICSIDAEQMVKVMGSRTFVNSKGGFSELEKWMESKQKQKDVPLSVCLEATGVYHENCALYLHLQGFRVSVILPNRAKRYLQSLGLKSKNDAIDARGLAQMGAEQVLRQWQPMNGFFRSLRNLTRHHQSLQEQRTATMGQLHALEHGVGTDRFMLSQLRSRLRFLEKQLGQTEKAIGDHIASDSEVKERIDGICLIKGLSTLSVATVLAETDGFELFTSFRQLVSYAGYDVVENQSGNRVGKTKVSKKGNSRIRRILHMPALTAVSCREPALLALFERTYARHGIKMKSYVAVQKKLLLLIYHLWKNNTAYDRNHRQNIQGPEQMSSSGSEHQAEKEVAPAKAEATQGRHPANHRSMPPLGEPKLKKSEKMLGF